MSETKTAPLTVDISPDVRASIEDLARRTGRDVSVLAEAAIERYVAIYDSEVASIAAAIAEIDAGASMVSNDRVMAWIESWGTPDELPPPT